MKIEVRSRVRTVAIDGAAVRRAAAHVLRCEGCAEGAEIGVLFAGDRAMRTLNRRYRGVDRVTDVLAFPLGPPGGRARTGLLGDVAISPDRARACARSLGTAADAELLLYLVHGILHLCGYDDESARRRLVMERRQRRLVAEIARRGIWRVTG